MPRSHATAALACFALAGCGRSPTTTFLALEPIPPATAASYSGPLVRVPFLRVPATLDRPEFVRQVASTVEVSDVDRWAAPLGRMARNTLIQDLQARLPAGKVLPPDAGPLAPEVRVEATVLSFTVSAGEAVMNVSYRLVPAADRSATAPATPRPLLLRTPLSASDPVAQAGAWSTLLGQLSDRIVGDLTTR